MEVNKNTIKITLGSFLVMTGISMGMVTIEQLFLKACLLFVAHTFLKHIFSLLDPTLKLNWTQIKVDLAWKGAWPLMIIAGVKINFLGTPLSTEVADILTELSFILIALYIVRHRRLHRNHCQDIRLLERNSLASDSARTTFSFLENIIKGKKDTMKQRNLGNLKSSCFFEQILENHFEKEKITALRYPKLVLLFPEGREGQENEHALGGGVESILGRAQEKVEGSKHTLTNESISYEYYASSGRHRRAQLEVLKIFRNKATFDSIYVAISEIRLLRTFYQMLSSPCIDFRSGCSSHSFFLHMKFQGGRISKCSLTSSAENLPDFWMRMKSAAEGEIARSTSWSN